MEPARPSCRNPKDCAGSHQSDALLDDGTAIAETDAILAYLDRLDADNDETAGHPEKAAAHR